MLISDDVKGNVSMVFEITIQIVFDVQLNNPNSERFKELSREVEISVRKYCRRNVNYVIEFLIWMSWQ